MRHGVPTCGTQRREAAAAAPVSRALDKGLTLLGLVADGHGSLGELSRASGLPKSTVHRLTSVLAEHRLLRYEDRRFRVDYRLLELGEKARRQLDHLSVARPYLQEASRRTGETVHFGILRRGHVVYLEKVEGERSLQLRSYVGLHSPACTTALGKVLIAHRPPGEWDEHLLEAPDGAAAGPADLRRQLREVRRRGVAYDLEENEPGTRCVAAPVWDASGRVAAAVSISGASVYLTDDRLRELTPVVRDCATSISRRLGGGERPLPHTPHGESEEAR